MKIIAFTACLLFIGLNGPVHGDGILFTVSEETDTLVRIDPRTLTLTTVGALGVVFDFGGLAFDPRSRTLFMVDGRSTNSLFAVNMNTGSATLIGTHGVADLFGLAYDTRSGSLYGTQFSRGSSLYRLDTATGAATFIGQMDRGLGGLAYNSDEDTLVGSEDGPGHLHTVDRATGSLSRLFTSDGFINDSGLAYDPERRMFWHVDWDGKLLTYDVNAGFAKSILRTGLGALDGLEYVVNESAPVPEPSTLVLLGGATLTVLRLRKRDVARTPQG
jgi:uncharacterized protein YjiK